LKRGVCCSIVGSAMYLRRTTVRKSGKTHSYWRLVRAVRQGRKVRQETVAYLGELDAEGCAKASALARHFLGEKVQQAGLFEDRSAVEPLAVRLAELRLERSRSFGDVWLGWLLWQALGLDDFCDTLMPRGKEAVAWSRMAAILVLARLCEPSSELHIAESWYGKSALPDLLGVPEDQVHHTRLYQALDHLLPHRVALMQHLQQRFAGLFDLSYDLLLYDVTSTYFEGQAAHNPLAQRGHSRDSRGDCKQVCLGLVVTRDGYPLGYELFAGNRTDVTTVEDVVEHMEARYGKAQRVWVMDRGMTSADNLSFLAEGGRRYLVGTPKSELRHWEQALVETTGWQQVREGLAVKLCPGPQGAEVFILCRSADRQAKEAAMHERFSVRIEKGLASLSRRLERARRPIEAARIERQLGRLLERNSRAAGKYQIRVVQDAARAGGLALDVHVAESWSQWASLSEGCYVLRSNVTDWTPEELWRTYIQLTAAEAAFRVHKSELSLRPIWHQSEERVAAHILVCFLAYALWKTLEGWGSKAGLGHSPRKVLDQLARISSVDVVLPLQDGRPLRLRCIVRPDKDQAALLDRLGLRLPQRLRVPAALAQM
jgi:transposase